MKTSDFERAQKLRNNGKIDEAVGLYLKVRKENLKKNPKLATECLHMIGVAYYQVEKFAKAEKYLQKSLEEFEKSKDSESAGFVLRDLAMNARGQKKIKVIKKYLTESIDVLHEARNFGHEGMSRVKLARIFAEMGDFEKAYEEVNKGIKLLKNSKEKFFLSSAYLNRAKIDTYRSLAILDANFGKDEFKERRKVIKKILES